MRSTRFILLAAALVAAAFALTGCGADSGSKALAEAVYARSVPVYRGASFSESMGSESWGDEPDSYTQGQTWWFETKASKAELLAYYQKLYPNAEKTELDSGCTELRFRPEGAERFEDVTIVIGDHELRIGENVTPNTKARLRGENVAPTPAHPGDASSAEGDGDTDS